MADDDRDNLPASVRDALALLERYHDDRPLTAIEIAEALGLAPRGNRESKRREVRFVVEDLREVGYRVCASDDGYWLARGATEWAAYLEARKTNARFDFVAVRKMTEAARDRAAEQGVLFETTPVRQRQE